MVGLLRVLSILHISVCMPMRWLAGNCVELKDYNFGVADMPEALDLMDVAFGKVADDGDLLLDEDFMMGMFEPLLSKINPFQDYMTYMFDEKRANLVGSNDKDDRIFPFQLLKDELWDPTRRTSYSQIRFVQSWRQRVRKSFKYNFVVKPRENTVRLFKVQRVWLMVESVNRRE